MNRLIIIGAGPGGYETAVEAVKEGLEVTLITEGPLGGTCLNEGCIPTKVMVSSNTLEEAQNRRMEVISQLQGGIAALLRKVNVIEGHAQFISNDRIKVLPTGEEIGGAPIIIATGSKSASLPIPGAEKCLTSKEMLELTEVPENLCVIGGGVIGLEFASVFNKFGSKVTVLEYAKQILPRFDTDLCKRLKQSLSKQGINILTSAEVKGLQVADNGLLVEYESASQLSTLNSQLCLMAVGRRPNMDGLGLENTGIESTRRGITVDDNMQTTVPGVYAIGDVNGRMMLAHVATFQGKRALNHILGRKDKIRFDIVPSAVFTVPEVATVGLTEEDCKAQNIPYRALKSFYRANGKAVSMGETEGLCKILVQEGQQPTANSQRLLGAHIMGAHSSDLIHEIAALMNLNATLDDLRSIIHAHPTLAEIILNVQ